MLRCSWTFAGVAVMAALVLAAPTNGQAQPPPRAAAPAVRLAEERLHQRDERFEEGLGLVLYGSASVLAGGVIAAIGHADERWLWAGLGTLAWGAINIPFGVPMMDPGGGALAQIDADRGLSGTALARRREELARGQYGAGSIFAFNGGLDVFYVASGILLAILGHELDPEVPALTGYGVAMAVQGIGLLVYDLVGWARASARGDRLLHLAHDAEQE
jgi:hypothetical protein